MIGTEAHMAPYKHKQAGAVLLWTRMEGRGGYDYMSEKYTFLSISCKSLKVSGSNRLDINLNKF